MRYIGVRKGERGERKRKRKKGEERKKKPVGYPYGQQAPQAPQKNT